MTNGALKKCCVIFYEVILSLVGRVKTTVGILLAVVVSISSISIYIMLSRFGDANVDNKSTLAVVAVAWEVTLVQGVNTSCSV